jgi:hypothetical protein
VSSATASSPSVQPVAHEVLDGLHVVTGDGFSASQSISAWPKSR